MSPRPIKQGTIAFLLSILAPGLGQIYNGQWWKGIFFFGLAFGFPFVISFTGLVHHFSGLLVYVGLLFSFTIFAACEAAAAAARQVRTNQRPAHTWRSYALGISMLLIEVIAPQPLSTLGLKGNRIATDSMSPTLLDGDRVMSDTRYYRSRSPQRGDVIIFLQPPSNDLWLKRVVAIGGDTLSLKGEQLTVNGSVVSEPFARYKPASESDGAGDFNVITIPANHFFLMGDDRDESYDSRHVGPLAAEKVVGKALYIYWSQDKSRIGQTIR